MITKNKNTALPGKSPLAWIKENTAILVVHGIGNQLPYQTIDDFGRGLIKEYKDVFKEKISLSQQIIPKPGDSSGTWFDYAVRIHHADSQNYIDVYEYYWADYNEDKADFSDILQWLDGVVKGADEFYKRNEHIGKEYNDTSVFFKKNGELRRGLYRFVIKTIPRALRIINLLAFGLSWCFTFIPFVKTWFDNLKKKKSRNLANVIGDLVIYNVLDPKCKFYKVKREIHDGAVKALQFLIEKENGGLPAYPSVVIAGHSLGSQVAYDAINTLNLNINEGLLKMYDSAGIHLTTKKHISQQLKALVTFGSPLDKIAFFLRENIAPKNYLKQQLVNNQHGFRMHNLESKNETPDFTVLPCPIHKHLETIVWRNYYDKHDPVSGSLDYYHDVANVDCSFKAGLFTHSNYWDCGEFYNDIILNTLS